MKEPSGPVFALPGGRLARRIRQRKRPVQARSQATVDALLTATLQVLRRRGPAGLTTTAVAERAGVSVGTLYQYFPDKRALVTALKVHHLERIVTEVQRLARSTRGRSLDESVPTLIRGLLAFKRENLELTLALNAAGKGQEPHEDASSREVSALLVATVAEVLEDDGPFEDPQLVARILTSATEGVLLGAMMADPHSLASPALEQELVRLTLAYARAARRAAR